MDISRSVSHFKADKELQEKLYTNVLLLNMIHPPTQELLNVLKKDMFAKNNKAAFLHVVHYLLTILNPVMAKEKLVTWPTCNVVSRENKFRGEVLQYLNELNLIYEDANLPGMLSSHLLAPGGFRFINFMFKLSQLVMYEDLKRENSMEIVRPRKTKNEMLNARVLENIVNATEIINIEVNESIEKFEKRVQYFRKEVDRTIVDKDNVNKELGKIDDEIKDEELKFEKYRCLSDELQEKIQNLKRKYEDILKLIETYNECKNAVGYLAENKKGVLDLSDAIKSLNITFKKELSELPVYTTSELEFYLEKAEQQYKHLEQFEKHMKNDNHVLVEARSNSKTMLKKIIYDMEN